MRALFSYKKCTFRDLSLLPAYSPKLNLIEMVWKKAKYHWSLSWKNYWELMVMALQLISPDYL
ncbi:hypothetical protein EJO83_26965 [Salmonella enterica]|uniref:Tc1-like transposase DDE domain-containing protein n=1 Tax=Salmonella diarizonae TaxID=59204 RepID=A0A5Y1YFJ9_SALDZ|nr:hypothetical protein [Salmonella enterica]EBX5401892.1 hypothetical protein [Salmonella enterica subsp. enterica serovar Java]ECC3917548.1 hypothetical protein [Salmonella enterica subsp. diarizonae]EBE1092837.1 hypothetical protein [Salmonella enterica]ECO8340152.1 hypothetical protein [Salmonella enterica]